MNSNVTAAIIIAFGLAAGGFLMGGRYEMIGGGANAVTRLDRYTGEVSMCVAGMKDGGCGFVLDPAPKSPN